MYCIVQSSVRNRLSDVVCVISGPLVAHACDTTVVCGRKSYFHEFAEQSLLRLVSDRTHHSYARGDEETGSLEVDLGIVVGFAEPGIEADRLCVLEVQRLLFAISFEWRILDVVQLRKKRLEYLCLSPRPIQMVLDRSKFGHDEPCTFGIGFEGTIVCNVHHILAVHHFGRLGRHEEEEEGKGEETLI